MKTTAVIDRFEQKKAVLLVGEEEVIVSWPKSFLPEKAKEGDFIKINIDIDVEATAEAKKEAEDLLKDLTNIRKI
ncbi:DUF3006 domain-containing protein [Dendrosporobacter sp. 1207_IL3150]|uniref:DUF3006 domain-containing protein n=1 Tax=Dendrosporobacter sp. 1207_IL3150 TaxID=3084054 RepID=UPI002FDA248A